MPFNFRSISYTSFNDEPEATANLVAKAIVRLRLRLTVKRKLNWIVTSTIAELIFQVAWSH